MRIELSYIASHLREIRENHPALLDEEEQNKKFSRVRSVIDSVSGDEMLETRAAEIETSFDRVAEELDTAAHPAINDRIIELQSAYRQGNTKECIQIADDLLASCERAIDIDPLYEGTDPLQ